MKRALLIAAFLMAACSSRPDRSEYTTRIESAGDDVYVLHLASVASAGAIHLLCGAGRVPFGRFVAGTAIGLAPPVAALVWLGAVLRNTLLHPSLWNGFYTVAAALAVAGVAYGLRTILLIRQFAPALSGHRQRAEFG